MVDLYAHCADYYSAYLGTRPLDAGFPARLRQQHFWTLSHSDLALATGNLFALAEMGVMEKVLKHFTATLLARAMRQTEVPAPTAWSGPLSFLRFVFQGPTWMKWWSDSLHNAGKLRRTSFVRFAYNFYFTKSGSLPPSRKFVDDALIKHRALLTTEQPEILDSPPPEIPDLEDRVCSSIHRAALEIFGGNRRRAKSKFPSLGSSFHTNRASGGAAGELFEELANARYLREEGVRLPGFPVLGGFLTPAPSKGAPFPFYMDQDPDDAFAAERDSRTRAIGCADELVDRERLVDEIGSYWKEHSGDAVLCQGLLAALLEDLRPDPIVPATVVPLLEAFKVRTITKGDMDQYHLARRWQTQIHGVMRQHPNCRLIGQPANADFLTNTIFSDLGSDLYSRGGFIVSGDYESATDCLHPHLSEVANDAIGAALGIPFEDLSVLKRCLTGHDLYYSATDNQQQTWGQLMGSPASFPILCLLNLAATRTAYEIALDRQFNICELPAVVNGDDIGFIAADQRMYDTWKTVTAFCGLKFSLGKNYTHRKFLVINSERYRLTTGLRFKKVPILNYRLLLGGTRSSATGLELTPKDQGFARAGLISQPDRESVYLRSRLKPSEGSLPVAEMRLRVARRFASQFAQQRGLRFEQYQRWFVTLPQRQGVLLNQLRGDYKDECGINEGLGWFRSSQLRRLQDFEKEFPGPRGPTLSNYLPRALGGLGLLPPPGHNFSVLDCAIFQQCKENPGLALEISQLLTPGLARASLGTRLHSEVAECTTRLGLEPTLVPMDEWDEYLERHGEAELPYDLTVLYGFSCHQVSLCDEDFNFILDNRRQQNGTRRLSDIMRAMKIRSSRMEAERRGGDGLEGVLSCLRTSLDTPAPWLLKVASPKLRLPS
jgi:hypothetical protein